MRSAPLLGLLLWLYGCGPDLPPGLGDKIPDAELRVVDAGGSNWGIGTALKLSDLEGRPIVLDFWASWCGPCRLQHQYVTGLKEEHGDRVAVVGVLVGDTDENARVWLRRHGATYPTVRDVRGTLTKEFWVRSLPRFVLLTPDRRLSWDMLGGGGFSGPDSVAVRLEQMLGT